MRANPQTNRIEFIMVGPCEFRMGSTLATKVLGLDKAQLAPRLGESTTRAHYDSLPAQTTSGSLPYNLPGALTFDRG
jgi:hypothetical protein